MFHYITEINPLGLLHLVIFRKLPAECFFLNLYCFVQFDHSSFFFECIWFFGSLCCAAMWFWHCFDFCRGEWNTDFGIWYRLCSGPSSAADPWYTRQVQVIVTCNTLLFCCCLGTLIASRNPCLFGKFGWPPSDFKITVTATTMSYTDSVFSWKLQ